MSASKGNSTSPQPGAAIDKPKTSHGTSAGVTGPNKMTERERLQASLRQTLTEFKEQQTREKRNGQAAQGGQKAINNRLVGNYLVGKTIGSGTFGKVREGIHQLTQEKVAIKILEKDKIKDQADITRVMREIHILKIVRHPNIVQLYEIIETSK